MIKYIKSIYAYPKNIEIFSLFTDVSLDKYSHDVVIEYVSDILNPIRRSILTLYEETIYLKILDSWKSRRLCIAVLRYKCLNENLCDTLDITKIDPVIYWICNKCPLWCFQQMILLI